MYSFSSMSLSGTNFFQAYASFAASIMMVRSIVNEFIPHEIQTRIFNFFGQLFGSVSTKLKSRTLIIDEFISMTKNQVYDAAELYLRNKISPSNEQLHVGRTARQAEYSVTVEKGEEILDMFENVKLKWKFVCESQENRGDKRYYELVFDKKYMDMVMKSYFPYVEEKAKEIKLGMKVVKLYSQDCPYDDEDGGGYGGSEWGSINLEHPSTFDTLAMDPKLKEMIIDDLDRFLRRKEFYKRVGKAWKRGYLLYGPPGTGKSSLIAAMANYLKFDIYDLELSSIYSNSELRRVLLSTSNRSILVIEDIDCNLKVRDRDNSEYNETSDDKLTLSGILNLIDGLWSSCGDERIIIFTTNHKEKLDSALLRPGRMDVHVHLSYCTVDGFKHLASRYHGIDGNDSKCNEIEELIRTTDVTPAEVAEELMKTDEADVALEGVVQLLNRKKKEAEEKAKNEAEAKVEKEKGSEELGKGGENSKKGKKGKKKRKKN